MLWGCGDQWSSLLFQPGEGSCFPEKGYLCSWPHHLPAVSFWDSQSQGSYCVLEAPGGGPVMPSPKPLPGQVWSLEGGASTLAKGTRLVRDWARLLSHVPCFSPNFIHTWTDLYCECSEPECIWIFTWESLFFLLWRYLDVYTDILMK